MPGISFRISLDGSEQVNKQLQSVAQTAEQSFASTTAAVSKLGRTADQAFSTAAVAAKTFGASAAELQKVQSTIQAVADQAKANGTSFSQLARNYDRASGAIGGAAAAFAATAQGARNAGKAAEESARGFSLSRREIGAVRTALRELNLGVIGGEFAALGRVASVFGPWAIGLTAVGAAAAGATGGLFTFAEAAVKTATTLGELAAASGVQFKFMSSLQIAFATGGTTLEKFAQELGNLQEKIAEAAVGLKDKLAASSDAAARSTLNLRQATLTLREAQLKARSSTGQLTEAQQKNFDKKERLLARDQARLAVNEAARKQQEAEANNLDDLVKKYNAISQGVKQTFNPLTTLESKAKAVTAALADVKDPEQQFQKLADIFKNLSELDRAQLGKQLGLSPETIATLSRGSEVIRQMQAEIERLGLALDNVDKQDLSNLKNAQSEVAGLFDALKNKMGALASPAFTSFFDGLAQGIKNLVPEFLKLAEQFGRLDFRAVGQAVAEFALQLAKLAVEFAKAIEAASKGDWSALEQSFRNAGGKLIEVGAEIGTAVGKAIAPAIVSGFKDALVESLTGADPFGMAGLSQKIIQSIKKFKFTDLLISPAGAAEAGGGQLGGADFGPMIAGAEVAAVKIKQIFADAFNQSMTIDFSAIVAAAQTAATELQLLFFTASQQITETFASIDISSVLGGQIDLLINKLGQLATAAAAAAGAASSGGGAGGGALAPAPFARGGLFGGRGTGTSDSNLAWVSRGEHIMPARAVAQPGVLAFLEALRRSGGNLRGILDDMGRFARGGLVLPAFANGGLVGGMSNVTIQFPGLPPISGLRASSDVVEQLHRAAALAQVRSGGRKPSRYS